MNKTVKCAFAAVSLAAVCASAFEYNVTQPSIRPRWSGAAAGEWTMDREAAFAQAKAEGAYTIVLFTGSWWCPICQTCEGKVLKSQAWADYVAEKGFYLVECDYPYRFPVPAGQEGKSLHPELGDGWGFKCWLYDAGYLADNGLTAEEGLAAIQKMYDYQDALALPGSVVDVIGRLGGGTMDLHKILYPTMILFRPDGSEVGRVEFPRPWYQASAVSDEEAIDFMIKGVDKLLKSEETSLFDDPTAEEFSGKAAAQYQGWLTDDETGEVAGTIVIKATKANKDNISNLTATIVPRGGRKVNLKGKARISSENTVNTGCGPDWINLCMGSEMCVAIQLGANGFVGSCETAKSGERKTYSLQGGRNVFSARDADAKARAATLAKGFWPIVFETADNGGSAFANGYSGLSVTVGNRGMVKVSGTLGDGNRVNVSAQAIMGENGKMVVPVIEKKGTYSFLLEFNGGRLTAVKNLSAWNASGRPAKFTATWSSKSVFSPVSGVGAVPSPMYLTIAGFDAAAGIGGKPIVGSPADDMVVVARNKWTGTKGISDLNVTFKPKDGTFKGSFNFYVLDGGKPKKLKATVSGVVVDGVPYGTAVIKNVGSWAIKLTGSCGGGC